MKKKQYFCCRFCKQSLAQMAESVDALVSNTSGAIRAGSTPALGTSRELRLNTIRDNVAHMNLRRALALPTTTLQVALGTPKGKEKFRGQAGDLNIRYQLRTG